MRRFLATFGDPAVRETVQIIIDVNGEKFIASGTRTIERGWHEYYGHFVKLEEEEMPAVDKGEEIQIEKIDMLAKETQPPKRYTPASIIKELERKELGTKATRASIVESLYDRGYVADKALKATDLGIKTCETLEKYSPTILDEQLTRHFEEEMDKIREGEKKGDAVLEEARGILTKLLKTVKSKEKEIGKNLSEANIESMAKANYIGPCPNCKDGKLEMRRGKFGRFIACNNYPECKTTFSLPKMGLVKSLNKECPHCKHSMISIQMMRKRPQEVCINPNCPSKKIDEEKAKSEEKQCPKCKEGKMVLRRSVYGSFLGCSTYPKCRYTEKLSETPKQEQIEEKDPVEETVEAEQAEERDVE